MLLVLQRVAHSSWTISRNNRFVPRGVGKSWLAEIADPRVHPPTFAKDVSAAGLSSVNRTEFNYNRLGKIVKVMQLSC
jgi:hypothetical protein